MTVSEEQGTVSHVVESRIARFWLRELPYLGVLVLTIFGVTYTSVSWQFLAVAVGLVCVTTGWLHIHDPKARLRMIWTQALHWVAFLVAMNIVLLANVQLTLTATATGLTLLMLLALDTFVAGVLVSWQICGSRYRYGPPRCQDPAPTLSGKGHSTMKRTLVPDD
jgi:hypothetical protein